VYKLLFYFFFILLLLGSRCYSQSFTIQGQVVNSKNHPVEFMDANLTSAVDATTPHAYTDSLGNFLLSALGGSYILILAEFGKEKYSQAITVTQDLHVGKITVDEGVVLDSIMITAKKKLIERKVDRLVFHVENSVAASGGNSIDALKITPGIHVKNNQISMVGKSSLSVMIEDKIVQLSGENLIDYLQSISNDDIRSIEVITTPPARYDSEGNSGIINIRYKKGRNNSWSNRIRSTFIQTTYLSGLIGNDFVYKKDKLGLRASVSGKKGYEEQIEKYEINYPEEFWDGKIKSKLGKNYVTGNFGVDYSLNENSSIGLQYLGNVRQPNIKDENQIKITDDKESYVSSIISKGNNDRKNNNHSVNFHYENRWSETGKSISADFDYFTYNESQNRPFNSRRIYKSGEVSDVISALNSSDQEINSYSAKIDFELPTKFAQFTFGTKYNNTKTNSLVEYFDTESNEIILVKDRSDKFIYTEGIFAGYFDVRKTLGTKWQAKFGLRIENTHTNGKSISLEETNKGDYTKLFPSFFLLYELDDDNTFNLNYSKRINRPAFWELNPFRWYLNSTSFSEGNPFLQPSFLDNFEMAYSHGESLFTSLFLSIQNDGFSQLPYIDAKNQQQIYTRRNYFSRYNYGFSQTYIFNKLSWWESVNYFTAYYSRTKFDDNSLGMEEQNGLGLNFSSNNSFTLNKTKNLQGEIDFWYSNPNKEGLYKITPTYSLDIGLRMLFFNEKLSTSIMVSDILKSSAPYFSTQTNGIKQKYYTYQDNRFIRISLAYSFGNRKIKSNERDFGNEDIKSRSER